MKNPSHFFKSLVKSYQPLILSYIGISALFTASCIFSMTTISLLSLLIPFSITLSFFIVMHALLWTIARAVLFSTAFLAPEDICFHKANDAKQFIIQTPSSALQVESDSIIDKDDVVIIAFNPNAGCFDFDNIPTFSTSTNYKKVRFQYRGTSEGTGAFVSEKDLIENGAAVILAVLKRQVKPKNIVLYGLSLGGAVATLSLAHIIKENSDYKDIKLVSDRSFSSISAVLGPYMGTLFYPALKLLNLNFDAGYAWQHDLKDVHKVCFYAAADEIISRDGSLQNKASTTEIIILPDHAHHTHLLDHYWFAKSSDHLPKSFSRQSGNL